MPGTVARYVKGAMNVLRGTPRPLLRRFGLSFSVAWHAFRCPVNDPNFLLKYVAAAIDPDYRFTGSQLDWWRDPEFNRFLDKFQERDGFNAVRHWTLYQLLHLTETVPGDTAECGVFRGAASFLMATANARHADQPLHFGFDSFQGLSTPNEKDGEHWSRGDLCSPIIVANENLASFGERVRLYQGWIPERFTEVSNRRFRFVHLDVDLFQPTLDGLTFFYERVNEGGIVLCDDYAWTTCPGATAAVNTFLKDKPERMLMLPAGGGFFIRGVKTGDQYLDLPPI